MTTGFTVNFASLEVRTKKDTALDIWIYSNQQLHRSGIPIIIYHFFIVISTHRWCPILKSYF
jgi:hypothetical protein